MLLKNKNVIITGTNRGIGKAMLEEFARNGANIWAHAREETPEFIALTEEIAKKFNVEIWRICFDLTDYESMKRNVITIRSEKKEIHGLVNNAGITYNALFQMSSEVNLRQQFEVNVFSVFFFSQYISKLMTRQNFGSIVNISSTAAFDGNPGKAVYGATKAAVHAFTKSMASELGANNIRVNSIAPGITETDMLDTMPREIVEQARDSTDLKRGGEPSEIASTAIFLISDEASYITGQVIRVDGGLKK